MSLERPSFYLAHPILSRKTVREWELKIEKKIGIDLKNPFYDGKGYESGNIQKVDSGQLDIYDRRFDAKLLVETDLDVIDSCDGVLAICDENLTIGTPMELMYAKLHGIPIITVCTNKKTQSHPWLRYCSDESFKSFDAFEDFAESQYNVLLHFGVHVALTGKARSGKDTVADMLGVDLNFKFSEGVKAAAANIFGFTRAEILDKPLNIRRTLQQFATEGVRNVYPNAWVDLLERKMLRYARVFPNASVAVTDLRFCNEAEMLRKHNYKIVRVFRPAVDLIAKDEHQSEMELEDIVPDYILVNDGTKERLSTEVRTLAKSLFGDLC